MIKTAVDTSVPGAAVMVTQRLELLPLAQLTESATNPRKTFNKQVIADLAASVKEKGVLVPILARPWAGGYEVVAGACRVRAALAAGLESIPAIVRELSDTQALEVQVIENLQRSDVHPLEEGEGYRALLKSAQYDVETLAAKVGKTPAYVHQRLRLADLIPAAKKAFLERAIHTGHAVQLARLTPELQKDALEACRPEINVVGSTTDRTTVPARVLGAWIADRVLRDLKTAPWDLRDEKIKVAGGAPACADCPKRAKNNPTLFSDLKGGNWDTCTDGGCFAAKLESYFSRIRQELEADGQDVSWVSDLEPWKSHTPYRGKGLLWNGDYKRVGARRCTAAKKGILVEGADRGKVIDICLVLDECPTHWPKSKMTQHNDAYAKADRARQKKRAREMEIRRQLLAAVILPGPLLRREDWELVAVQFFLDVWHERRRSIAKRRGWKDFGKDAVLSQLALLSAADLQVFLLEVALSTSISPPAYGTVEAGRGDLVAAAERHGVDVQRLLKDAAEEARTTKGAKAKAASPEPAKAKTVKPKKKPS